MDCVRLGRTVRALRLRRGWRQQDLGEAAGVSQDEISLVERGHCGQIPIGTLARIAEALGAELHPLVRWRGGDIDRLLDEGHAALVSRTVEALESAGWTTAPEVTFAIYADRGSIDILGWHSAAATVLVVEVKTELTSLEETLRVLDTKTRLASRIAADRFGWRPRNVARLLVLPDTSTARRRVDRHDGVLARVFTERGHAARSWLRDPFGSSSSSGPLGLLLFLSVTTQGRGRCGPIGRRRVRRPNAAIAEHGSVTPGNQPEPAGAARRS